MHYVALQDSIVAARCSSAVARSRSSAIDSLLGRTTSITIPVRGGRPEVYVSSANAAETHERYLLIRGMPYKTVVAPILAADAVMDKE